MKSILLVDDSDAARDAYATLLEWAGYRALVAANGEEACEVARSEHPDLIVMDLNMPVLNGWEAARLLKADPETAEIPVIALSAWLMGPDDLSKIADCGFASLYTKPLPPSSLLEDVRARLGAEPSAA